MSGIRTLIHLHTNYSYDSDISLATLADFVQREGIGCVAVTDHDTIVGARRFRHETDAKVVVGEEVSTRDGHLIGLFLEEPIAPGMSASDTAIAIREQGGIVLLPHPFVEAFSCGLGKIADGMVDLIDAVEVNNAQNFLRRPDRKAERFADRHGLIPYVGADSHMQTSIAPCYQTMPDFNSPHSFLDSLRRAELTRGRHPLAYFAATGYRLIRYYAGLTLPGAFGVNHVSADPKKEDNHKDTKTQRKEDLALCA